MKKVLALVLTLAMLVGTLAVGLSAAFEFTATEDRKQSLAADCIYIHG